MALLAIGGASRVLGAAPSDHATIISSYRQMDAAYDRSDVNAYAAPIAATLLTVDQTDRERKLTRPEILKAVSFLLRPLPGKRVIKHEVTQVSNFSDRGDIIQATGTRIQEALVIDPAGNKGYVRDTDAFVETWIREKTRWRLSEARTLRHQRAAAGSPSPALMAQLDQMRTLNAQMRGFNAANNLSKCMHSNDLASLSLDEQRSRCSP